MADRLSPRPTPAAHVVAGMTALIVVFVGLGVAWPSLAMSTLRYDPSTWVTTLIALFAVAGLVAFLVYRNVLRLATRIIGTSRATQALAVSTDAVIASLAAADFPCRACGYNLRGITTPSCPECNQAVTLILCDAQARPTTPGFGLALAWAIIAIVGHLLSGAVNVLQLLRFVSATGGAFGGGSRYDTYLLVYALAVLLSAAVVVTCLIRLIMLFSLKPDRYARWAFTTIAALIVLNIVSLVMNGFAAVFVRLW